MKYSLVMDLQGTVIELHQSAIFFCKTLIKDSLNLH